MEELLFLPLLLAKSMNESIERQSEEAVPEPADDKPDDIEFFPLTYLPEMYYVQTDVAGEELPAVNRKLKLDQAKKCIEANRDKFENVEEAVAHLFLIPNLDKQAMLVAIKDYCDHLTDLIDRGVIAEY